MALAASIATILKRISGNAGDDRAGRGSPVPSTPAKRLAPVFDAIDETVRPRLLTIILGDDARLEMLVGGRALLDAVATGADRPVSASTHEGKTAEEQAAALAPLLMEIGAAGGRIRVLSAPLSRPAANVTGGVGAGDLRRICEKIEETSHAAASEAAVQALMSASGGGSARPAEPAPAARPDPVAAGEPAAELQVADPSGWQPSATLTDMFEALSPISTRIVMVGPSGTAVRSNRTREGLDVQAVAADLAQDMLKWAGATEPAIGGRSLVLMRPVALDGHFLCMMADAGGVVAASVEVKAMARIVALERARWAAG